MLWVEEETKLLSSGRNREVTSPASSCKSLHCLCPQERAFEVTWPLGSVSAWDGAGSAGPGFPVLGVLVAPVGPQRRGALGLGQSRSQGGQVGGGAREGAAPAGLGGALKPEPRAASPACSRHPANPAWPHQQPVAGAAPEVLLPSDGAVVLTCGERNRRWRGGSLGCS